jgi:putative aldouronate transport system substrate-binding protein
MYKTKSLRKVSVLLAVMLVFAIAAAGCGKTAVQEEKAQGATTAAQSSAAQSEQTATAAKEGLKFAELNWYMPPPINPQKNQDNVMAEINKYLKEKINASLKFNFIDWGAYDDKMKVMSAAGDKYDLTFTTSWTNKVANNVSRGAFVF